MVRETCRACEGGSLVKVLDLGMMPLAGGFLRDAEAARREKLYALAVHCCRDCGLVQILDAVDPDVLFQDYSFSSSTIRPLVEHFEEYAEWLAERLQPRKVLEFGCNDGVLLAPLEKRGIKAVGVDVSGNITEMARGKGLDVVTGYFGEENLPALEEHAGTVDVVTGSNVFAHNDRPDKILRAAAALLRPGGYLCLEVMYAGDLLEQLQWDTLYHEHLSFYCLSTLETLLGRHSFRVIEAERIPMHGGSLRVVATRDKEALIRPSVENVRNYERAIGLASVQTWLRFGEESCRKIRVVEETFGRLRRNSRIAAYGAAGKATMWVNACKMDYLDYVVDASPLRAEKLMPGTHTPIVFPDEMKKSPTDIMFVTAWNYAGHIKAKESWYPGLWSVPLPELKFF